MSKRKTFVMSDESLNMYGFRVLTDGIDLTDFEKNPQMLFAHMRPTDFSTAKDILLPIGHWENVRKEGDKLIGDAVFDEDDEFAMKVWKKVEKGVLNAVSIGFVDIELSEDPMYLVPGQSRPTATKSKLKECSIVDIPANANAVKLFGKGSLSGTPYPTEIDQLIPHLSIKNHIDMKLVLSTLALGETASEQDVVVAIGKLNARLQTAEEKAAKVETLSADNLKLKEKVTEMETAAKEAKITALVSGAITGLKYVESDREMLTRLATADFEYAEKMIGERKPYKAIHSQLSSGTTAPEGEMTFKQMFKECPQKLSALKLNNYEEWARLYKADYGVDPAN